MDYKFKKEIVEKIELRLKKIDELKKQKDEREVKKHN